MAMLTAGRWTAASLDSGLRYRLCRRPASELWRALAAILVAVAIAALLAGCAFPGTYGSYYRPTYLGTGQHTGIVLAGKAPTPPNRLWVESAAAPERGTPSVTVSPDSCRFEIPIGKIDQPWKWNKAAADVCEYSWMVAIHTDNADYHLGFSHFSQGRFAWGGTFPQLLRVGQTDLWRLSEDKLGASVVEGVAVHASVRQNRLVFELRDKEWIERLFRTRPATVTVEASGSEVSPSRTDCRVRYEAAGPEESQGK